jgi:hypothetical protein
MIKNIVVALLYICFSCNSFAERVFLVNFVGQPLMSLKNDHVQTCGVRFMAVNAPDNPSSMNEVVWVPDASFNLDRSGFGMVKAVLNKTTVGDVAKDKVGKIAGQEFKTFWMKASGKPATHPIKGEAVDGENKPSKIYATYANSVLNLYEDITQKRPIILGINFGDANDFAFSGVVSLKEKELEQLDSCMNELLSLIIEDSEK